MDITPDAEGVRPIAIYTYDAGGERILKHSNTSVSIYLNGKKVADTIQVDATLYPSGMLVAKLGNNGSEEEQTLAYTKHYYAGTQRVSSKIGTTENLGDYLQDWFTQGTGGPVDVIGSSFGVLENAEEGVIQVYDELGIEPPTYESTPVFIPVASFTHGDDENEIYWFLPDHLGSTSYISNILGEVSQHMEYFAFGETFVEEHRSSNNSPYKFNGKELDEETGWYYYGARHYDPRISVWLSVDPYQYDGTYLSGSHNGGIYNSFNLNGYIYCYQKPTNLVDPNGKQTDPPSHIGILAHLQFSKYMEHISRNSGNWKAENPLVKSGARADLMYYGGKNNQTGQGAIWELKPVSYRKEPKLTSAKFQLLNYVMIANTLGDGGLFWNTGTSAEGTPKPFDGTLTLKTGMYEFKYFITDPKQGLIYYTYTKSPDKTPAPVPTEVPVPTSSPELPPIPILIPIIDKILPIIDKGLKPVMPIIVPPLFDPSILPNYEPSAEQNIT